MYPPLFIHPASVTNFRQTAAIFSKMRSDTFFLTLKKSLSKSFYQKNRPEISNPPKVHKLLNSNPKRPLHFLITNIPEYPAPPGSLARPEF